MRVIIFCFILFIFLAIFAVITIIFFGYHPIWAFFIYSLISAFIVQKIYPLKDVNFRDLILIKEFISLLKNRFFYYHLIAGFIVTLFLFWLTINPLMNSYTMNGEEFELKDFQSLTIEEASSELEQLGLEYQILDSVFTDSVTKGAIFTQNPIPGTFVKEGRLIYFTVNHNSSQKFEIPDVYNKSKREATNQLRFHFKVEFDTSENYSPISSVVTMIKVGNHEVFPGQKLIEGTTITIYFGFGRGNSTIIVPLLIGSSAKESKIILEQSNLKVGSITSEGKILDTLNAIVINQRPLSESRLQAGDMVDLVITQFLDSLKSTDSTIIE